MDKQLRAEQTALIYSRVGHFIVSYSFLLHQIKFLVRPVPYDILEDVSDSALIRLVARYVRDNRTVNPTEEKITANITKRLFEIEERRNAIVHSSWFVGWGNEQTTDWSEAERVKASRNRDTNQRARQTETADSLGASILSLLELGEDTSRLLVVACNWPDEGDNIGRIERSFVLDPDGRYRTPVSARTAFVI